MGRRRELEKRHNLLARFGHLISGETRLDALLNIIAEEVRQILAAERCSLFLVDHAKNELWTKVALGVRDRVLRVRIGQGIAGFVAQTGMTLSIPDAYADQRFSQDMDRLTGYKTKSVLAMALKSRDGRILGVLEVLNKEKGVFKDEDEGTLRILAMVAASLIENATLYEELRRSHMETIYRMALVAEFRDQQDTGKHLRRMSRYSAILASAMGMNYQEAEDIRYAAPLHDVGKVAIPDSILRKPGKLEPEEYEEMKRHTLYGSQMLANAESRLLRLAAKIAIAHHEHFDGTGYPYGIKGETIPIEARIVSVADVFDALMSKRVYKQAWSVAETVAYIKNQDGKLFDPRVIACLDKSVEQILAVMDEENSHPKNGELQVPSPNGDSVPG